MQKIKTKLLVTALLAVGVLNLGACKFGANDSLTAKQHHNIAKMADNYKGKIAYGASFDALNPTSKGGTKTKNALFNPGDAYSGLPHSIGYEETFNTCTVCHSAQLVMTQNRNAIGWNQSIDTMIKERGMMAPDAQTRTKIVEYLATNFGDSSQASTAPSK